MGINELQKDVKWWRELAEANVMLDRLQKQSEDNAMQASKILAADRAIWALLAFYMGKKLE